MEGTGVDKCSMSSPVLVLSSNTFTACVPSLCTYHPSSTRGYFVDQTYEVPHSEVTPRYVLTKPPTGGRSYSHYVRSPHPSFIWAGQGMRRASLLTWYVLNGFIPESTRQIEWLGGFWTRNERGNPWHVNLVGKGRWKASIGRIAERSGAAR